ncbi:unnamed protein product [Orchesella dallaii]|uniref:Uncharacterized protein n=1 Tax=Orchesella dallaii TaxID=48710 RepID=A0ABP1PWU6_9HEXA
MLYCRQLMQPLDQRQNTGEVDKNSVLNTNSTAVTSNSTSDVQHDNDEGQSDIENNAPETFAADEMEENQLSTSEQLQIKIDRQNEKLQQLQNEFVLTQTNLVREQKEKEKADVELNKLKALVSELEEKLATKNCDLNLAESKISFQDGRIKQLEEHFDEIEKELKDSKRKIEVHNEEIVQLKHKIKELQDEKDEEITIVEIKPKSTAEDVGSTSTPAIVVMKPPMINWQGEYHSLKKAVNQAIVESSVKDLSHLLFNYRRYKMERDSLREIVNKLKQLPIDLNNMPAEEEINVLTSLWHYINICKKFSMGYSHVRQEIDATRHKTGLNPLPQSSATRAPDIYGNDWENLRNKEETEYVLSFLHGYDQIPPSVKRKDGSQRPAILDGMNIAYGYLKVPESARPDNAYDKRGYRGILLMVQILQQKMQLADNDISIVLPFHNVFACTKKKLFTHEVIKVLFDRGMIVPMPSRNTLDDIIKKGELEDYDDL